MDVLGPLEFWVRPVVLDLQASLVHQAHLETLDAPVNRAFQAPPVKLAYRDLLASLDVEEVQVVLGPLGSSVVRVRQDK